MEGMHPLNHNPAVPCAQCAAMDATAGLLAGHRIEPEPEHARRDGACGLWRRRLAVAAGIVPGAAAHAAGIALLMQDASYETATEIVGMVLCGVGAMAMVAIPAFVCYRPRFSSWQEAMAARDNYGGAAAAGV